MPRSGYQLLGIRDAQVRVPVTREMLVFPLCGEKRLQLRVSPGKSKQSGARY